MSKILGPLDSLKEESLSDPDLQRFSKESGPKVNVEAAAILTELRKKAEEDQRLLKEDLQFLRGKIDEEGVNSAELQVQIELLDDHISNSGKAIIASIVSCIGLDLPSDSSERIELEKLQGILEDIWKGSEYLRTSIAELIEQLQGTKGISQNDIEALKSGFLTRQRNELINYLVGELQVRDIEYLRGNYQTHFLHGISTVKPTHESITIMGPHITWETKLRTCLALKPELSCVSYDKSHGDKSRLYHPTGVILQTGRVTNAWDSDNLTRGGLKASRTAGKSGVDNSQISEKLHTSITSFNPYHNEININNADIAGIYVSLPFEESDDLKADDLVRISSELCFPLYSLFEGDFYTILTDSYVDSDGVMKTRFIKGSIVTKKEVYGHTQKHNRGELLQELLNSSPFDPYSIDPKEAIIVSAKAHGIGYYKVLDIPEDQREGEEWLGLSGKMRIDKEGSSLFFVTEGKQMGSPFQHRDKVDYYIVISGNYSFYAGRPGTARDLVDIVVNRLPENIPGGEHQNDREDFFQAGAAFLYGIAEQADKGGDHDLAEYARLSAKKWLEKDTLVEILQRRVGQNGEFKICLEDIRK